jgi:hypothetical protein
MGLLGGDARVVKGPEATSGLREKRVRFIVSESIILLQVEQSSRTCLRADHY